VVAIKCSQVETVNIFLDRGIVELAVDYHQLHCTAGSGQTEVGRLLLKRGLGHHTEKLYGRDRWPWPQTWSNNGDTPLYTAAISGKVDFILRLDHGANVDSNSFTDVTPAHVAAQRKTQYI
jgi:hypothetical protein